MFPTDLANLLYRQVREAEEAADRVYDAVIGIVVDNKDPEKLARVKVKFPWLPGEDTSWWAPMCGLGAGKQRGWFFLPEIDDEVLVMFEHGDIRRPVIIGALWNGTDKPADKNDGNNERRTIVSRSGSRILFDDDKGEVVLEDGNGDGKITISTENKITIESGSGDCCFQAPAGEMTIVAKEIKMEGQQNFHIDSASGTNIGGDSKITFKGMMLSVQGATVDLNTGGAQSASDASASPEDVPDPVGG